MSFLSLILLYLGSALCFFVLDLLWLGVFAKGVYDRQLGHLLADSVHWPVAVIFYLIFIVGILYFAVVPGLLKGDLSLALLNGALFGFFTYATYELTNFTLIQDWPSGIVLIDILWGTVLCFAVAGFGYWIGTLLRLT